MQSLPRITVEVPVLSVGTGPGDYGELGSHVLSLRRQHGLHLTLLHIGILAEFARDIAAWTKGATPAGHAVQQSARWLRELPVLSGFSGTSERLVVFGGGGVSALEVHVPDDVRDYQAALVDGLRGLLDGLYVDNVDDFILSSPALGYKYPRWIPHVAVGRPMSRSREPVAIAPVPLTFGESRIRNGQYLPA